MKRVFEGMQLILSVEPDALLSAEHDEIWAGGEVSYSKMTAEQKNRMEELGWTWDGPFSSWHHFT